LSDQRDRIEEPRPARKTVLAAGRRAWQAGSGRALTARGLPAVLAIGGFLPIGAGGSITQQAARPPSSVLCQGYAPCNARGFSSHGYGARGGRSYWRMSAGNQCTNYAAFVESTVFHAHTPGYLLGNGGQWASTARAHGVTVNRIPAVGAVAEWDGGAPGIGPMGHVAVVEKVGPHDRYIMISQQHIGSDTDGYEWTRINAGFPRNLWQEWPDNFIHFRITRITRIARGADVGYFNRRIHSFRLRDSLSAGPASEKFALGSARMIPLAGNWNGARRDGVGYYDPRNGTFHLRNSLHAGRARWKFAFGPPGMIPLAGDWDGDGRDGVGYYDPRNGTFHLRNSLHAGKARRTFAFGPPGMIPLAGDWKGTRRDGIGYYDPRNGIFHLRNLLSAGGARYVFRFGPPGMIPLVGNWTGRRKDGIGYYDPRNGTFHLRNSPSAGRPSYSFRFGPRGMIPLAGNWNGA
jgi:surface antigen